MPKTRRVKTRPPMIAGATLRLKKRERELLVKAAMKADETISEFVRGAVRERTGKILGEQSSAIT